MTKQTKKYYKLFKRVLIVLLPLLFVASESYAQKVGTTSFQFLKVIPNARSTAMGDSFTPVAVTSESLFWNPAGIVSVNNFDVTFSHVDWFIDTKIYSMSLAYSLDGFGVVGLFGIFADYGTIHVTEVSSLGFLSDGSFNPGLTGESISPSSYMIGVSYARSLTDKFSFGFSAKYAGEDLIREKASTLLFDAGLIYETGFRSIQLGAVIRQFGPEVSFVEEDYPLPQTFEIGVSTYLISGTDPLLLNSTNNNLLLSYSIVHPRDYEQQQAVGMEYSWNDMIFLRGGYKINFDEESYTLGFGVKYIGARVDYSYMPFGDFLDNVHRFSVGFSFE